MKVSARNMLQGKVASIRRGAINAEVSLTLPGNETVIAMITNESVDTLGLAPGVEAFALIKAPLVILAKEIEGMKFSTRNVLEGTVRKVTRGQVNAEVSLELSGGSTLSAIITEQSVDNLSLQEGDKATALFKASSVILATAG